MFDRWFDSYRWWWCVLCGVLLIASFAPFSIFTCAWIALVPAWWVISRSEKVRRHPLRYGYLVGLILYGAIFWWIGNVTVVGAVALILYLALYPAMWFLLLARLMPRPQTQTSLGILWEAIAAAALWIMLEWWRDWFLTGFNWNELGVSQSPSIIYRQLAAFGGVHLISFLLVAVNILWAEGLLGMAQTLKQRRVVRASPPFAMALFLVAVTFAIGWFHLHIHQGEPDRAVVKFTCVQPNIPQIPYDGGPMVDYRHAEELALEKTEKLSYDALSGPDKPDLLIWPEAFTGQEIFGRGYLGEIVREVASATPGYFLLGAQDSDVQHVYNCAYLFGPGWDTYQYYRKTHLVIVGEFLPLGDTFPWLRDWAGVGMDMTPGPGPRVFAMKKPDVTFAPLICFEDTLPEVASKAAALHPDFFVTITNDGWYTGWCAAWGVRQHLANAVFRCVEQDRPMIRCANTGVSCIIDEYGTVSDRCRDASGRSIDVSGLFSASLRVIPHHTTIYEVWGDWIVLISSVVSAMLGIRFLVRK